MNWKVTLAASMTTVFAALVMASLQGCLSAVSEAPASSIVTETPLNGGTSEKKEKEIRHQPTILRAEAAAPPVSDRPADLSVGWAISDASFDQPASPGAVIRSAHPQIADLLPIPTLDAPPPNQR